MSKVDRANSLEMAYKDYVQAKVERDSYELEYEVARAEILISDARVRECRNQAERDAKTTLLLHEDGRLERMALLRTKASLAYTKWATFKSLLEN